MICEIRSSYWFRFWFINPDLFERHIVVTFWAGEMMGFVLGFYSNFPRFFQISSPLCHQDVVVKRRAPFISPLIQYCFSMPCPLSLDLNCLLRGLKLHLIILLTYCESSSFSFLCSKHQRNEQTYHLPSQPAEVIIFTRVGWWVVVTGDKDAYSKRITNSTGR